MSGAAAMLLGFESVENKMVHLLLGTARVKQGKP